MKLQQELCFTTAIRSSMSVFRSWKLISRQYPENEYIFLLTELVVLFKLRFELAFVSYLAVLKILLKLNYCNCPNFLTCYHNDIQ